MDLSYPSICFSMVALFVFLAFFTRRKTQTKNLPPGNLGWPLIGESLDLTTPGKGDKFVADRMKLYSPQVFKTSLLGERMAVFCGAAGNKFVFSNENKFVQSWLSPSMLELTLVDWKTYTPEKKNRSIANYTWILEPETISKYVPVIDSTARQNLKDEWAPKETLKVLPAAQKFTFTLSCRLFMGMEIPGEIASLQGTFATYLAGIFSVPINFPGTRYSRGIKAAKRMHDELLKIIRQQKLVTSEKKDSEVCNALSRLLLATNDDGKLMGEDEMASTLLGLLVAGNSTTSSTITSVVYYLADHPQIYNQVLREQIEIAKSKGSERNLTWEDTAKMKFSRNVINEVLRLAPHIAGTFREAIDDIKYAGFLIPKGWKIFWSVHSTHRDPKYFPDPEKFDPTRFEGNGPMPFTYTPFGGGPGMCPGQEFARQVILVFLHNLVLNFKWAKLDPNEKIEFGFIVNHPHGLPIKIQRHGNQAMENK